MRLDGRLARLAAVLLVLAAAAVPAVSGHLDVDNTKSVWERSCYCHDPEPSPDLPITVNVSRQVGYTPDNKSVTVEVGILGDPVGISGFGLMLNASKDASLVKWDNTYSNATSTLSTTSNLLRINGTVLTSKAIIHDRWFNVSFKPGRTEQTLELTVIGMRADDNGNETGDTWNIVPGIEIEVRKQRLMNLTVAVSNKQPIIVSGILVDFYIDGEYIGNNTVASVPPNGESNATIAWDVTYKRNGKYKLRAVIDPQGRITETDRGNNEVTTTIWLGNPPETPDRTPLYAGIAVVAVVVVLGAAYFLYRRRLYRF